MARVGRILQAFSLPPDRQKPTLNEPLLLALLDRLCEGGVVHDDGGVGAVGRLRPLGLVGVVGALVTEHVAHQEDQDAQGHADHHGDDPWGTIDCR